MSTPASNPAMLYTGMTTQATVDSSNAEDLATGAYAGGRIGNTMSFGAITQGEVIDRPRYFSLAQTLETAIVQVDVTAPPGVVVAGAIQQESGTMNGDCGGDASYTIDFEDTTGDFWGTFEFNDYCFGGVTLSGGASFSGEIDLDPLNDFLQFSLSFDNLTMDSASDSITTSGDIAFNYQTSPATATMDILMRDNNTDKIYWTKDYSLTTEDMGAFIDFAVSGKFYDPDYGWVDVTTTTHFQITVGQTYPYQGVLVIDGDTGTVGGSTKARLTVQSIANYEVEADTDGDGNYDWGPEMFNWP